MILLRVLPLWELVSLHVHLPKLGWSGENVGLPTGQGTLTVLWTGEEGGGKWEEGRRWKFFKIIKKNKNKKLRGILKDPLLKLELLSSSRPLIETAPFTYVRLLKRFGFYSSYSFIQCLLQYIAISL